MSNKKTKKKNFLLFLHLFFEQHIINNLMKVKIVVSLIKTNALLFTHLGKIKKCLQMITTILNLSFTETHT